MEKTLSPAPDSVRETTGMRRWLRLTARKTVAVQTAAAAAGNPAADAAANALAALLKDAKKMA